MAGFRRSALYSSAAFLVAAAVLAACGGNSSTPTQGAGNASSGANSTVKATVTIPFAQSKAAGSLKPQFVSPSALGLWVVQTVANSTSIVSTQAYDLTGADGSTCRNNVNSVTCTVSFSPTSEGTFDFYFAALDQAPQSSGVNPGPQPTGAAKFPVGAHVLSMAQTPGVNVNANPFALQVRLEGLIASFSLLTPQSQVPSVANGQSGGITPQVFTIVANDAQGNSITDSPYINPVQSTLTEPTGDTGHTTINQGASSIVLTYDALGKLAETSGNPYFANVSLSAPLPSSISTIITNLGYGTGNADLPSIAASPSAQMIKTPFILADSAHQITQNSGVVFTSAGSTDTVNVGEVQNPPATLLFSATSTTCASIGVTFSTPVTTLHSGPPPYYTGSVVITAPSGGAYVTGSSCTIDFGDGTLSFPVNVRLN